MRGHIQRPTNPSGWRARTHEIIFEADTPAGKFFDVALIVAILLSVLVVMLDSVAALDQRYGRLFAILEWGFTLLFTVEYLLRLLCVGRPLLYARSFFGIIDLLAILPTYLSVLLPGSKYLVVIRVLRVLRVFRVLKLVQHIGQADMILSALRASRSKITVFVFSVLTLVVILGSLMYLIEGPEEGFTSIPVSVYWAVVTLTTVGYGDISPRTPLGQAVAACIMILGYSLIAVPTGLVTAHVTQHLSAREVNTQACPQCGSEGHDRDAHYCKRCGARL